MTTSPTRAEHAAVLAGAVGLVVAIVAMAIRPEAPPVKGAEVPPIGPALALLACGVLLVAGSVRSVASGWRARHWPRATGTVLEARSLGGPYVYVRCRYAAGGAEHEADEVQLGRAGRVREGTPVGVKYDPEHPSRGAFAPMVRPGVAAALAVGVGVVGVSALLLAWG